MFTGEEKIINGVVMRAIVGREPSGQLWPETRFIDVDQNNLVSAGKGKCEIPPPPKQEVCTNEEKPLSQLVPPKLLGAVDPRNGGRVLFLFPPSNPVRIRLTGNKDAYIVDAEVTALPPGGMVEGLTTPLRTERVLLYPGGEKIKLCITGAVLYYANPGTAVYIWGVDRLKVGNRAQFYIVPGSGDNATLTGVTAIGN